ncbi:MAG: hypothetical protein V4534_06200 [Myxococcota bacterium]
MGNPEELLSNLQRAILDVEKAKKAILALSRDSEPAVRVLYRLGLYLLHEEHDLEGAASIFSKLSACTIDCDSRSHARLSYSLLLWTREQYDASIDLLKRMVAEDKDPNVQALALDYLRTFMKEHGASGPALAKIDEQRIQTLQSLLAQESDKKLKADYQTRLDAALNERES